ncbi:hypothetical protein PG993_011433 [Apiospora rasikravindrae]|uniref:Uncharacterized protein n=1 Tax=Apiospora rasikravindrae TaxID=990691 RepID=A0ABR1SE82_9PEZI
MQTFITCYNVDVLSGARPASSSLTLLSDDESNPTEPTAIIPGTDQQFRLTQETRTSRSKYVYDPVVADPERLIREAEQQQQQPDSHFPFSQLIVTFIMFSLEHPEAKRFDRSVSANKNHQITLVTELNLGHHANIFFTHLNRDPDSLALDAKGISNHDELKLHILGAIGDDHFMARFIFSLVQLFLRGDGIKPKAGAESLSGLTSCLDQLDEAQYVHDLHQSLVCLRHYPWLDAQLKALEESD